MREGVWISPVVLSRGYLIAPWGKTAWTPYNEL